MPPATPEPAKIADNPAGRPYSSPAGVEKLLPWPVRGGRSRVRAKADWLVVRENGVPAAEVFYVSYTREPRDPKRPLTFLFNGGPGAASAFLHMGTAGPKRVRFGASGQPLPPPVQVVDNTESWLRFSDLVFVDPVGTGFSRTVHESRLEQQGIDTDDEKREKRTKALPETKKSFFKVKRDIDVLCEFVSAYLSRNKRWDSPITIAGESYGGFRVGKLMRALPERGVGVCSAVMISPALDFLSILGADYNVIPWTNSTPTMALVAAHHGKARGRFKAVRGEKLRAAAEDFAEMRLAPLLLRGERAPASERKEVLGTLADLIGLSPEFVERCGGRIPIERFGRELLRDEGLICGLYDGSITGPNVFPDREGDPNPDPTLAGITAAFSSGINTMLRGELGLTTDREYLLMSEEVWKNWADDRAAGYWDRQLECADDIRYGLANSPGLNLLIAHGWYDLVTTYFSSLQSVSNLRLPPALRKRIQMACYNGGHMFYTWEGSRKAIVRDVEKAMGSPKRR